MVINEEGKVFGLPVNTIASEIYQTAGKQDIIVGNALVCDSNKNKIIKG